MSASPQFVSLCQRIGSRIPVWTQGAGGNISVKTPDTLWIKASGERLDQVTETRGGAGVDLSGFLNWLNHYPDSPDNDPEADYAAALKTFGVPGAGRPSMESGFHAALPESVVLHFHSLASLLMARKRTHAPAESSAWWKTLPKQPDIRFLPAIRPGWLLLHEVAQATRSTIYVLGNHGVILQGADDTVLTDWQGIELSFCEKFGYAELRDLLMSANPLEDAKRLVARSPDIPLRLYFPDTAVFLKALLAQIEACGTDSRGETLYRLKPSCWQERADLAEIWLATQVLYRIEPGLEELPAEIASQVADLPVEKFRRQEK